ncbi:Serine/threonine-protein kinase PKH2 [Penicillium atrosanguineum]|uniref:non-specific serine/threonine protein kinase n=1 Tax=Penicillium atrosanguineum TaxID=1132637 RepID=A0A9W9GYZ8_9EURO|nr:L-threo-3-deoxy-hexylosonate aldolase [Penicillium atrosanguineum]KAJ5132511.1 Serine/threonine-protein kinase PKH2 [Penicillium atrosanguineum]KAJ5137276.1 Serine/threonine-protein kinase PKH2 [Penicillium atrosanguineum]KAJ5290177.1 L-threo-3-deoxy-hexylosonate aldolase [Penicillium atrosanguineum]KAJ5308001.1 Serine/threonine-protein kinase PKH2 [Penicillium atrosanguineum]
MPGMGGDLSLSQSLGGLRIANPDDSPLPEDATDPGASPCGPTGGAASTPPQIPESDDRPTPFPAAPVEPPTAHENRLPVQPFPEVPQYSASQYQAYSALPHSTPPNPNRPLSSVYTNGSAPSALPRDNSYRMRTDSGASSTSTSHSRLISRDGNSALQAGVPARDNSHSDRSYRTAQIPANGPAVMRQSSRAHARGTATPQMSRTPYGMENGPAPSSDDWQDRGAAVSVRQEVDANGKTVARYIKKGVRDFNFGNTLGEGSYSTVVFATDRQTLKEYAIKILDKRHIIKEKKVKYVNIEKDTLNRLTDHPGIVRLYYTFQDERSLYFVLDLAKGGELLGVLKRMSTFDEECTRFYGAQILDTIDYMHKRGVIHRDLKPENVLLDHQMHVKITDFGTAKILKMPRRPDESTSSIPQLDSTDIPEEERASSFVGTAEYVSPELLTDKNACKASDLWAFGCIIYQLLAGRPPFKAGNEYQTFQKIVALDYEFPIGFPAVARDLVERLLVLDPARRLQIEHIKNHEFFDGISWGTDMWKQKAPRLKAYVPPAREPIKLNGGEGGESLPPTISTAPSNAPNASTRALPRVVTELPPPSQLDIEWSPVLSKSNERILKLGNLVVLSSPASHSPTSKNGSGEIEAPKKLSRFFSSTAVKKRQRLVMVTSSARIILVAAGGDEKKAKLEISLLAPGTHYRSTTDAKGHSSWIVDTREKHYVFEDPKPSSSNIGSTAVSAQEWLDALDRAREMGLTQQGGSYSADDAFRDLSSGFSSHANTLERNSELQSEHGSHQPGRLIKHQATDMESTKGRKRFSRRHSKNGLAAVF